jgi:hypothetical protein
VTDTRRLSHRHDPDTSGEAAASYAAAGKRTRHRELVLGLVRRLPGLTACELWAGATAAERAELGELQRVRQRLTDLLADGRVRQGSKRQCRERGSLQMTWLIAAPDVVQPSLFGEG